MNERLTQTPQQIEEPGTTEIASVETDLNALAEKIRAGTYVPDKDKVEAFFTGDPVIPTDEQRIELARIRNVVMSAVKKST